MNFWRLELIGIVSSFPKENLSSVCLCIYKVGKRYRRTPETYDHNIQVWVHIITDKQYLDMVKFRSGNIKA